MGKAELGSSFARSQSPPRMCGDLAKWLRHSSHKSTWVQCLPLAPDSNLVILWSLGYSSNQIPVTQVGDMEPTWNSQLPAEVWFSMAMTDIWGNDPVNDLYSFLLFVFMEIYPQFNFV